MTLSQNPPEKGGFSPEGNAESNALGDDFAMHDAQLAELVAAWPALSPEAKASILAIVRGG